METGHSGYCRKEKEIAEIHTDLKNVKKAVMGNGKDGLIVTVPVLAGQVERLNENVETNNTLTSGVLRFKDELEGVAKGKEAIRRRNRWFVGIAVTLFLGIMGTLIPLGIKMFRFLLELQTTVP